MHSCALAFQSAVMQQMVQVRSVVRSAVGPALMLSVQAQQVLTAQHCARMAVRMARAARSLTHTQTHTHTIKRSVLCVVCDYASAHRSVPTTFCSCPSYVHVCTCPAGGSSDALLGRGLVEELLPDSFLRSAFRCFFEILEESPGAAAPAVLAQARELEALLASTLGWDFRLAALRLDDSDGEEEGPVVVELTETQLAEFG